MMPFLTAQREALKQGLLLLEGVLTQPIGLAYDLRAVRQALFPEPGEEPLGEEEARPRRERPALSPLQALEALALVNGAISLLLSLRALDPGWAERARKVLARAEGRLGPQVREERARRVRGLYVILDPQVAGRDVLEVAEMALRGGARILQLRDKARDKGDQLPLARRLRDLCQERGALFIVNDHADLASASSAHGLHIGQHDLPLPSARRLLAPDQVIGRSNATVEEAVESQAQGADYIAIGPMFPTATKEKPFIAGPEALRRVKEQVTVPVVAIGGITEENVGQVLEAGADAVAVISAVVASPDPEGAARRLAEKIESALARRRG